ncbi:LacI family transcriptional regulator [Georgenia muralis]|uniref:LacI family transcriptional regulator n=2 Tax=Georgenia muralis TaxID=154117 RepID=A0A3N4Z0W6_9MICO|nr:LacI family transcriptional regulator [Georgenia muralis]
MGAGQGHLGGRRVKGVAVNRPPIARMRDVARRAGVSHQTVSRVINNPDQVSPATRARVVRAIEELGYKRNSAARALSVNRSGTIGVIDSGSRVFGQEVMLVSVEGAARDAGYATSVALVRSQDDEGVREAFEHLVELHVEGIVVMGNTVALAEAAAHVATRIPLAMVSSSEVHAPQIIRVAPATAEAGRVATRHLVEQGFRRIAHIAGPEGWLDAHAREAGWRTELAAHGLADGPVYRGDWMPEAGYRAGRTIASSGRFDAVFAANDHMALGALFAFSEAGLRVPDDIAIIGFDDIVGTAFFQPPLSTIRQNFDLIGRHCIDQLLAAINGEEAHDVVVPTELIVRASSLHTGVSGGG